MVIKRYFCRFHQTVLDESLHKKIITTEEYSLIQKFWNHSIIYNIQDDDIEFLKSLNFQFDHFEIFFKITSYPHLKEMCLKICKRDPRIWKYECEEKGNFLFALIISVDKSIVIRSELDYLNLN